MVNVIVCLCVFSDWLNWICLCVILCKVCGCVLCVWVYYSSRLSASGTHAFSVTQAPSQGSSAIILNHWCLCVIQFGQNLTSAAEVCMQVIDLGHMVVLTCSLLWLYFLCVMRQFPDVVSRSPEMWGFFYSCHTYCAIKSNLNVIFSPLHKQCHRRPHIHP